MRVCGGVFLPHTQALDECNASSSPHRRLLADREIIAAGVELEDMKEALLFVRGLQW